MDNAVRPGKIPYENNRGCSYDDVVVGRAGARRHRGVGAHQAVGEGECHFGVVRDLAEAVVRGFRNLLRTRCGQSCPCNSRNYVHTAPQRVPQRHALEYTKRCILRCFLHPRSRQLGFHASLLQKTRRRRLWLAVMCSPSLSARFGRPRPDCGRPPPVSRASIFPRGRTAAQLRARCRNAHAYDDSRWSVA